MRAFLAAVLACSALAGCVDETLDAETYVLQADGVPEVVGAGTPFTFTVTATGDLEHESGHIGAHYWTSPTDDPTGDFDAQAGGCQHLGAPADVVGTHTVTCTLAEGGTYHLRGHIRIEEDETFNYWSAGHAVQVVDLTLTTEGAAAEATAGEDYNFTLHVAGDAASSDHIGAHYWDGAVDDPTAAFGDQAGGCDHTAGEMPGAFQVTCHWSEAGEYTLHGHVRITSGDAQSNFWSEAVTVTVSPS